MTIRWLSAALADLRAIKTYIAEQNPEAAQKVISQIRKGTLILAKQPNIGRVGRLPDTRELVINPHPYIVAYRESVTAKFISSPWCTPPDAGRKI